MNTLDTLPRPSVVERMVNLPDARDALGRRLPDDWLKACAQSREAVMIQNLKWRVRG